MSFLAFVGAVILASCGGGGVDEVVTIQTSMGDMTVILYEETPMHKANFLKLAKSGQYDSTIFHRVINDFMIQGGDIYANKMVQEDEADKIPAEISNKFYHVKGALAAARQPDQFNPEKKSSSCQFYIVDGQSWDNMQIDLNTLHAKLNELLVDSASNPAIFAEFDVFRQNRDMQGYYSWAVTKKGFLEEKFGIDLTIVPETEDNAAYEAAGGGYPPLDKEYTVFGRVVEGMDVLEKIAGVKTQAISRQYQNMPVDPIFISMKVKTMSRSEITDKYGYQYPDSK